MLRNQGGLKCKGALAISVVWGFIGTLSLIAAKRRISSRNSVLRDCSTSSRACRVGVRGRSRHLRLHARGHGNRGSSALDDQFAARFAFVLHGGKKCLNPFVRRKSSVHGGTPCSSDVDGVRPAQVTFSPLGSRVFRARSTRWGCVVWGSKVTFAGAESHPCSGIRVV